MDHFELLNKINSPQDLKNFKESDLLAICQELRNFIIEEVSKNPAHFGASLGVVELTVALHYVFNSPIDKIVWDVGHQAYGHKILTGRRDIFHTNRKYGGISGFPKRSENEHDIFGVGHSSTSISAALGLATASKLSGNSTSQVIAVIGDGSLTGGLAFEGLNNAGMMHSNLLVILNDNHISIDGNVGALSEYLIDITTSKTYNKLKEDVWNWLSKIKRFGPNTRDFIAKIENGVKSVLLRQSNLFESLNFRYFGPVDGHDISHLVHILKDLKDIPGPKLLHINTVKGKGFKFAEKNQTLWHATSSPFDTITGEKTIKESDSPKPPKYQDVFGHTLVELAEKNDKIVGITPAMPSGCSMTFLMKKFPHRAFDVGIAEQHAVTFSAGMAANGYVPFCNIYSSFIQRAYDQIIHDVALQNLPVVFCIDRAGLVGPDGATHHGVYDLSFLRPIPGITISSPMNEIELRNLMFTAQLKGKGPFVIRYPRGNGEFIDWMQPFKEIEIGKAQIIQEGLDIAFLTLGPLGNRVKAISEKLFQSGLKPAHVNMLFLKPLDETVLHKIFKNFKLVVSIEDNSIVGGLGTAITEFMVENNYHSQIIKLGIPDRFIEHGSVPELQRECELDIDAIVNKVLEAWNKSHKVQQKIMQAF